MYEQSVITHRVPVIVAAALAVSLLATTATANPGAFPVQYSATYICGWLPPVPPQDDQHAKPGDYATAINIHNPLSSGGVAGSYRIALFYPPGAPPPPAFPRVNFNVTRHRVIEIDCPVIWAAGGLPPGTFIKGAVHIGLATQLPVAAIYTSQTHNDPVSGPDAGAGHSIDIEKVEPFVMAPAG